MARKENPKLTAKERDEIDAQVSDPVVEITKEGIKVALQYKFTEMKIPQPDRWDKKWRVVIFDVSEGKKGCGIISGKN